MAMAEKYEIAARCAKAKALLQTDPAAALTLARDLAALAPNDRPVLLLLATVALQALQFGQALTLVEAVLAIAPDEGEAWLLRARALRGLRRLPEAAQAAENAARLMPENASAWHCAGFMKMAARNWAGAKSDLARATQLDPANALVRSQYALALSAIDDIHTALSEIEEAAQADPANPEILMARADIFDAAGHYDLARACRPSTATVPFGEASSLFLTGDFRRGLAQIAARHAAAHPVFPSIPPWEGQSDPALHLLVTSEQGYGDMIQFLRYVPVVRARVGRVSLQIPRALARLVRDSLPDVPLILFDENGMDPLPQDIGARVSFLAMPQHVGTAFDFASHGVPYLKTADDLVAKARAALAALPHPRIGFVWSGNPRHANDHKRSIPFDTFAPLIACARGQGVSLQIGGAGDQKGLFDAAPLMTDFAASAAVIAALDLVITIDSAPAHLAGALGKPVWTLLPFNPDWRWLLGREDTPWYPSMRLFRQKRPGDWAPILATVQTELNRVIAGDTASLAPQPWSGPPLTIHPQAVALR